MTKVVGYIRVSTEEQAESGLSLTVQRTKLAAFAIAMDLELIRVFEDAGKSAKSLDRPGLQGALQALRDGEAEGLLVAKLDRLTRNVADLGELVQDYFSSRYSLLAVGDSIDTRSAGGRLVLNVLGSVAQWEREAIAERTRDAMQQLKKEGRFTGGDAPYGFEVHDGELVPRPDEQIVVMLARKLRQEHYSLRAISAALSAQGHKSRLGKPFDAQQVARMLGTESGLREAAGGHAPKVRLRRGKLPQASIASLTAGA